MMMMIMTSNNVFARKRVIVLIIVEGQEGDDDQAGKGIGDDSSTKADGSLLDGGRSGDAMNSFNTSFDLDGDVLCIHPAHSDNKYMKFHKVKYAKFPATVYLLTYM